jgi:hypothetical protein
MCDYYILVFHIGKKMINTSNPKINTYPDGPEGEKEKPQMI